MFVIVVVDTNSKGNNSEKKIYRDDRLSLIINPNANVSKMKNFVVLLMTCTMKNTLMIGNQYDRVKIF